MGVSAGWERRRSPLHCSGWRGHTALVRRDRCSSAKLRLSPATGPPWSVWRSRTMTFQRRTQTEMKDLCHSSPVSKVRPCAFRRRLCFDGPTTRFDGEKDQGQLWSDQIPTTSAGDCHALVEAVTAEGSTRFPPNGGPSGRSSGAASRGAGCVGRKPTRTSASPAER